MDFTLTLEQQLLKDSTARLLTDAYDFEQRSAYALSETGWSRALWRQYAELGLLGIGIPDTWGGTGGGPFETFVVMQEMGRRMTLEPYVATAVVARSLLLAAGTPEQQGRWLPRIADGSRVLSLAALERASRFDLSAVETSARPSGDGWILEGRKAAVPCGDQADLLLVTAREDDETGISLFLVDPGSPGLVRHPVAQLDSRRAADIDLQAVRVPASERLGEPGQALGHLEAAWEEGVVALLAESIGCMDEILAATVEYLKVRRQFGRTLSSFQALQHRAVDMLMHIEQTRSLAILATAQLAQASRPARSRWIAGAMLQACDACRFVGEQAVQLHGGIGITMEHRVAHLFRRLVALQSAMGDRDHHLALFSRWS